MSSYVVCLLSVYWLTISQTSTEGDEESTEQREEDGSQAGEEESDESDDGVLEIHE